MLNSGVVNKNINTTVFLQNFLYHALYLVFLETSVRTKFGMTVIAYDPYLKEEDAEKLGIRLTTLESLLQSSDIVSIHALYTSETYHIIGARELRMMKKEAYIINTATGGLIDEKALKRKMIAGAALDVLEHEPPPRNYEPLKIKNVIVTPHSATHTREAVRRMSEMVASEIEAVSRGEAPRYLANPEVLYSDKLRIKLR